MNEKNTKQAEVKVTAPAIKAPEVKPEAVKEAAKAAGEKAAVQPTPKTAKDIAEKVKKEVKVKDAYVHEKQNGWTRPKPGSVTGTIWDIADKLHADNGYLPKPKDILAAGYEAAGGKHSTCQIQLSRWYRFHGLKTTGGRGKVSIEEKAEREAVKAKLAAEKAAERAKLAAEKAAAALEMKETAKKAAEKAAETATPPVSTPKIEPKQ